MAEPAHTQPSRGRWYILFLISVMYLITYLDRVNISTAAPQISKEFGFDNVTMGYIFAAFVWAYALFQVPGGWMSDRFGARGVLATIVAYWSIMTAATGLAFSATSFIVLRFLFGVGEAGAFPGATRAMQLWYPRSERGFVQGITHSASRAGAAIAPPTGAADHDQSRLALGVPDLRAGRIGVVAVVELELPQPAGRARFGEPGGTRNHSRPRPERRNQPAAGRATDPGAVGHVAALAQYVGDHARLFHLRLLPVDFPHLADEVSDRCAALHLAQGRPPRLAAAVGRCHRRHGGRPRNRLAVAADRQCQTRPQRRSDHRFARLRRVYRAGGADRGSLCRRRPASPLRCSF